MNEMHFDIVKIHKKFSGHLTKQDIEKMGLALKSDAIPVAVITRGDKNSYLYLDNQCTVAETNPIGEYNGLPIYERKPFGFFTETDLRSMRLVLLKGAKPRAVYKWRTLNNYSYLYSLGDAVPLFKPAKFQQIAAEPNILSDLQTLTVKEITKKYNCSYPTIRKLKRHFGISLRKYKRNYQPKKFECIVTEPNILNDLKTLPQKTVKEKYGFGIVTVRKLKDYFGITRRKYHYDHKPKKFEIIAAEPGILNDLKTLLAKEVKIKYGCSIDTIRKLKDYFGIPRFKYKNVRQPTIFQQIVAEPNILNDLKALPQKIVEEKYGCSVRLIRKLKVHFGISRRKCKWTHQYIIFQRLIKEPNIEIELKTLTIRELKKKYYCSAYTIRNLKLHFGIPLRKYKRK